jgi:hypothetical protein
VNKVRTYRGKPAICHRIPLIILPLGALMYHIRRIRGICPYFKPARAQVAFTPERPDRRRVIVADSFLLSIIPHAGADVTLS